MSETCRACSDQGLGRMMEAVESCKYMRNSNQYSAVETDLSLEILPCSAQGGFGGSVCDVKPCLRGDSVLCTVLATSSYMKRVGAFVHVGYKEDIEVGAVMAATLAASKGRMCLVFALDKDCKDEKAFHVYRSDGEKSMRVDEGTMIKTVLSLQKASSTLLWYWSEGVVGYSFLLSSSRDGQWAVTMGKGAASPALTASVSPSSKNMPRNLYRVMPFFYSSRRDGRTLVLGSGATGFSSWSDLTVDAEALSEITVDRLYCATSSTGRCFCCQYIVNIHDKLHNENRSGETVTLRLCRDFWQKTKGKKKRDGR